MNLKTDQTLTLMYASYDILNLARIPSELREILKRKIFKVLSSDGHCACQDTITNEWENFFTQCFGGHKKDTIIVNLFYGDGIILASINSKSHYISELQ